MSMMLMMMKKTITDLGRVACHVLERDPIHLVLLLLLGQCLCDQGFKTPELETSGFGVREGVFIKKTPTKKMRHLAVPQIHLAC